MAKIKDLNNVDDVLNAIYQTAWTGEMKIAGVDHDTVLFNVKTAKYCDKAFAGDKAGALKEIGRFLTVVSEGEATVTPMLAGDIPLKGDCYQIKLTKKGKDLLKKDLYFKAALIPENGVEPDVDGNFKAIGDDYTVVVDFHD